MRSIERDERGRLVPLVRPKHWNAASVNRSRDRSDRLARARVERKKRLTTTQFIGELEHRDVAALEAFGIPWAAVQRWLDEVEPREAFVARLVVKLVLEILADHEAPLREKFEACNELYRRLIAAGTEIEDNAAGQ
jgi:hypothetical protein